MEENAVWEKQWTPRYLPSLGDEPWDAVWGRLTEGFRLEIVPAGTVLYQQGDPADEVLYLQSGQVQLECVHSGGKRRVLCLLFDGIPVGEDECIYNSVREFRAVTATECQVFRIPAEVFKQRVETSPALALKLFQVSARKSQVLSRMLVRDSFLSARGRVIQLLLSLAERYGAVGTGGVRLTIRLTQQEIADFLGLSRVAVSHCIQFLTQEGLLAKRGRTLLLPDPEALQAQLEEDASARFQ